MCSLYISRINCNRGATGPGCIQGRQVVYRRGEGGQTQCVYTGEEGGRVYIEGGQNQGLYRRANPRSPWRQKQVPAAEFPLGTRRKQCLLPNVPDIQCRAAHPAPTPKNKKTPTPLFTRSRAKVSLSLYTHTPTAPYALRPAATVEKDSPFPSAPTNPCTPWPTPSCPCGCAGDKQGGEQSPCHTPQHTLELRYSG